MTVSGRRSARWTTTCAFAASLLTSSVLIPAAAWAGDVSAERLLNAASETQNWLHHHGDYAARVFPPWTRSTRTR